ncbi:Protein with carboxyl methyl esterase activity [Tulasnella sp. 419]|nr:Protein with carboxyl methyl esterase activity [Tulasnella sp. 419]
MSALQRSAIHARLSKLPHLPPLPSNEDDDDDGDESADLLGELSFAHREQGPTSTSSMRSRRTTNHHSSASSKYNPLSAASYFDQAIQVTVASSNLNFRVYYTPPVLSSDGDDPHGTILVCHHGAGFSALTFACFAKQVGLQSQGRLGVLALDARSHGKTIPLNEEDSVSSGSTSGTQIPIDSTPATQGSTSATQVDLSIETLTDDLVNLLTTVYPDPSLAPAFVLVGHSMGGTVVVRTCPKLQEKKYRISGVTVLDVVEGSALEAMPMMHTLLESRPQGFGTVEETIEWQYVHFSSPKNTPLLVDDLRDDDDDPITAFPIIPSAIRNQPEFRYHLFLSPRLLIPHLATSYFGGHLYILQLRFGKAGSRASQNHSWPFEQLDCSF